MTHTQELSMYRASIAKLNAAQRRADQAAQDAGDLLGAALVDPETILSEEELAVYRKKTSEDAARYLADMHVPSDQLPRCACGRQYPDCTFAIDLAHDDAEPVKTGQGRDEADRDRHLSAFVLGMLILAIVLSVSVVGWIIRG